MALFRKSTEVDKRRPRKSLHSGIMPHSGVSNLSAGRIALGYAVIAILWIAFSDAVVTHFKLNPAVMTIKGTLFVFVTALLLYFAIRRLVRAVQLTTQERDETAQLYRTVVEASNEGICLLDESERISFLNGRLAAMLGRPAEELHGYRLQDFIEEPHVLAQRGAQKPETYECRLRNDSDRKPWVLISRHPVLNDAGEVVQLVCTVIDITERRRAEEALALHSFALNNAHEAVCFTDEQARFLYVNEECCRSLGYTNQELLGMSVPDVDPDFPKERWPDHWHTLRAQRSLNFESHLRTKDGRFFPVEISAKYLEYGGRAFNLAVIRDITERKRAEEALRENETRFRTFVDHAMDAFFLIGDEGKILDVNRQACQSLGYTHEELITMATHDLDPNADAIRLQLIHEQLEAGAVSTFETLHRRKDGTLFPVEVRIRALWQGGRRLNVALARDITERKRAEEALRRSEAYLAESQRLTHTGSYAYIPGGAILYWSEESLRIWGFDQPQAVLSHEMVRQRIHPDDRGRVGERAEKAVGAKTGWFDEFRIVLPGGTVKHIHAIHHPVFSASGELVEVAGTHVDVTERKRAEEELRESETRFRTFVDHAGDALFVYDIEQRTVVDVNRETCESLGYTRQEIIGKTPMAFHPDSYQAEMESVTERAAAGETVSDRHWHRRKDGTMFPVEVHTTRVLYAGRHFLLMVARDISDRLRGEEQREKLRQLEADLAQINRVNMMGELTASIAHEVNQPLSGIVSNASACLRWLAADAPDVEEVREAVRDIVRDGKRAGEVVARIRALTKRAVGPRERLDLNETIREVLALVRDAARRSSVIVRTQFADDLSPVAGDRVQLQQVVLNLVMNAIEAMSSVAERGRELVIATRNVDPDQVQVTVEDSGVGLDPNTKNKIFDSFYTTKPGGMGMGLSISRSILQAHGGRLWATAKDSPGTVFHFTVPKYHEEEANAGVAGV